MSPNSQARITNTWGVIRLTLTSTGYDWQFVPVAGGSGNDSGHGDCH
jgi:hypothetical protein